MSTWWEIKRFGSARIEPVEVLKETAKTLVLRKSSAFGVEQTYRVNIGRDYYRTWEEAHKYLLEVSERRLESARRNLQEQQSFHGDVKSMKDPTK